MWQSTTDQKQASVIAGVHRGLASTGVSSTVESSRVTGNYVGVNITPLSCGKSRFLSVIPLSVVCNVEH